MKIEREEMTFDEFIKDSILVEKISEANSEILGLIGEVFDFCRLKLEKIKELFPEYTDHGLKHSKSVIEAFEKLVIGKDLLSKAEWDRDAIKLKISDEVYLTLDEIVLFILSALLHDIGMSLIIDYDLNRKARDLLSTKNHEDLQELKDEIRENHHKISRWFIENNAELKAILEKYGYDKYAPILADIVEGHRVEPSELFTNSKV